MHQQEENREALFKFFFFFFETSNSRARCDDFLKVKEEIIKIKEKKKWIQVGVHQQYIDDARALISRLWMYLFAQFYGTVQCHWLLTHNQFAFLSVCLNLRAIKIWQEYEDSINIFSSTIPNFKSQAFSIESKKKYVTQNSNHKIWLMLLLLIRNLCGICCHHQYARCSNVLLCFFHEKHSQKLISSRLNLAFDDETLWQNVLTICAWAFLFYQLAEQ